jgi:transposase
MHRKLPHVVSAITGVTGLAIIRAILAGERDAGKLAQRRDYRCKHDAVTMARALQGHWREEHLCSLAQAVALYEVSHQKLTECDRQIEAALQTVADRRQGHALPPAPRPRKRGGTQPAFAVREPLSRLTRVDLSQIEGLDETTSLVILSEMGLDRTRWPTVKHCTAWLGLCPHQRVSGGKIVSRRTTSCANRAATALRLAAAALPHRQSALGAFFRRMQARLGAPKAITATAHKLARLIDTRRKHGTAYVRRGMDEYAQSYRDRVVQPMTRRAKALGYTLVKAPEGAAV